MVVSKTIELDASELDEPSRRVLAAFRDHPARSCAKLLMERLPDATCSLVVRIPSPKVDHRRDMSIWLDEKRIPSLEFGAWHTHADLWDRDPDVGIRRLLDYLERIRHGEILLCEVPTVGDRLPFRVLDLSDREEVLDELTSPVGSLQLLSWSGDKDLMLDDLRNEFATSSTGARGGTQK